MRTTRAWIRIVWLLSSIAALVFAFFFHGEEGGLFIFSLVMLIISFPLGAVMATLVWFINDFYGEVLAPGTLLEICVYWLIFVVSGYMQWFYLAPRILTARKESEN